MAEQKGDKFVPNQMANAFKEMDAAFGTIPGELVVREPREVIVEPIISQTVTDVERSNDLAVTRETLHRILTKSEDALDDILHIAKASEHPRTFEVAGQLIKTVSDVAAQLIDLHKKIREIEKPAGNNREDALNGGAVIENQTNVVFTGTAADLMDMIAARRVEKSIN